MQFSPGILQGSMALLDVLSRRALTVPELHAVGGSSVAPAIDAAFFLRWMSVNPEGVAVATPEGERVLAGTFSDSDEGCLRVLGLRRAPAEAVDEDHFSVTELLRKDRGECGSAHLAVYLHRVDLVGTRTEGHATSTPDRRAVRTVTRAASTLLLPWLLTAASDFTAVLGVRDRGAGVRLHADDDLVHEVSVPLHAEQLCRKGDSSG